MRRSSWFSIRSLARWGFDFGLVQASQRFEPTRESGRAEDDPEDAGCDGGFDVDEMGGEELPIDWSPYTGVCIHLIRGLRDVDDVHQ
jgi:hypothetical protein